jgi:2,3-bisphosphoglycerate-independent phosphoglycerate mutase
MSITSKNPLMLIIMDGFGISLEKKGNAVLAAKTPNLREISEWYPGATLQASGVEVGLMWGEMGSSEVGHMNLGAGTVVVQNLPKINSSIKDKSFFSLPAWQKAIEHARKNNSNLHLMGLVSNGGVHSHIDHLFALLQVVKDSGFSGDKVFIHVFTDGQDTAPKVAMQFIAPLEEKLKELGVGKIATVMGRYYSMDKSESWDRTEKAYVCLTQRKGNSAASPKEAVEDSYKKGLRDETMEPYVILKDGAIKDNDSVIFFNYRADRARQLTKAFMQKDFNKFSRIQLKNLFYVSMMPYGTGIPEVESAFPPDLVPNPLSKVISEAGKTQFRIAETEKYAHVTYFFNGGTEVAFKGEERVIIPSKKEFKSYDEVPEMSAREIADRTLIELKKQKYDLFIVNFANGDMVGHTGNYKASVKAVEVLDECIGKLYKAVLAAGGSIIITADHGNVEEMVNLKTGEIDKEHSTNPVPFWLITPENRRAAPTAKRTNITPNGLLGDVAPTILELLGVPQPADMVGQSLLSVMSECPLPE